MFSAFNVLRRLIFTVLIITSLFTLSSILAAFSGSDTSSITRLPFFAQSANHSGEISFQNNSDNNQLGPWNRQSLCTPERYSAGHWQRHPPSLLRPILADSDVYLVSGFQGCASSREVDWHIGKGWNDEERSWAQYWRGNVSAYDWIPGDGCESYSKLTRQELVTQLVERGGWLILGDSVSENHFFSLSCLLYPHVRATPDYSAGGYFDRAWQQDLFLRKTSPLVPLLRFPKDFDIDSTPLVTFRRTDLLFSKQELITLYRSMKTSKKDSLSSAQFEMFSEEAVWDLSIDTYLRLFLKNLPLGNYNAMILSTAGHWTTTLFAGYHDESADGSGLANLLEFFEKSMENWVEQVRTTLDDVNLEARRIGSPLKQVIVRAYIPGHDGCHHLSVVKKGPVNIYESSMSHSYNWGWIRRFNSVFESVIQKSNHSNVHFLSIENPGLLRPDGHVVGDCMHIVTGAGIMEGWTQYISYFLSFLL